MKIVFAGLACALACVLCVGCGPKNTRPADLPDDMTPCVITVMQDGKPLEGASVELVYDTKMKYTSSGSSDEKGEATIMTYGFAGAQQGNAKILVTKLVTEGAEEAAEYGEAGAMGQDFQTVDPKYGSADTTDLTVEIGKSNVKQTVDVGESVHISAGGKR